MLLASRNNTSCIIINIFTYMRNEWQAWTYIILSENYLPIFFLVISALVKLHKKERSLLLWFMFIHILPIALAGH